MPEFHVFTRGKNKKEATVLFEGKPIKAVDAKAACFKAALMHPGLRVGRLFAKPVPSPVQIQETLTKDHITAKIVTERVEALSPEAMRHILKGDEV